MSKMVPSSGMQKVTLAELYQMGRDSYYSLWNAAKGLDRDVKLYLHWTAGRYTQFWDGYHVQIDHDGAIYVQKGVPLHAVLSGTWKRNTGAVSITILGCFDATTNNGLGSNPPTAKQLESLYMVTEVLATALDLTIDINHVMTHGEAADNEDGLRPHEKYGPKTTVERWVTKSPRYRAICA